VWIVSPTTLMAVLNTARAVMKDVETRKQIHVIQDALGKLAKDFQRFDERMAALARHIEQASRDVQEVHTSSRKISAHFRRIESVQLDEEDEGGAGNEEGGAGKFAVAGNPRGSATVAGGREGSPARFDAGQGLPAASSVSSDPF